MIGIRNAVEFNVDAGADFDAPETGTELSQGVQHRREELRLQALASQCFDQFLRKCQFIAATFDIEESDGEVLAFQNSTKS